VDISFPPLPGWCGPGHECHEHLVRLLTGIGERLEHIDRRMEHIMTALSDLLAADDALKTEVATFLSDIAGRLSSVDDASAEAVVADINAQIAALQGADPAAAPPAQ
jgi:hypothetical protein